MAEQRRRLEMCRRGGQFRLLASDGRQFSGSTAAELLTAVRAAAGDDPLALNGSEDIIVRRPRAAFAPILEALHQIDELVPRLDTSNDDSDTRPAVIHLGTTVNGQPWGWVATGQWNLVPTDFATGSGQILWVHSWYEEDGLELNSYESGVLLNGSVSLEFTRGGDETRGWVKVTYGVGDPWGAARTHLTREHLGLGVWGACACPF